MAIDHYVPQVHLKQFYADELGEKLYAFRKSDASFFTPSARSVCGIADGNTNAYFENPRIVEEFLRTVEPHYARYVQQLRSGDIEVDCVACLSGFMAYVATCSPTAVRIFRPTLESTVHEYVRKLDAEGQIPKPPPELGKSLSDVLDRGLIDITIDQKYPQAIGIEQIWNLLNAFGNSLWEIVHNPYDESPFFTSDYPVAPIILDQQPTGLMRVVPLAPNLAIKVFPDRNSDRRHEPDEFPDFRYVIKTASRPEVHLMNTAIVRSAESFVFANHNREWVRRFVRNNAGYRVEMRTDRRPVTDGAYLFSRLSVERKESPTS